MMQRRPAREHAGQHLASAGGGMPATTVVGLSVALGAVTMSFAALLFACSVVRIRAGTWPPPHESAQTDAWPLGGAWAAAATAAVLVGSFGLEFARRAGPKNAWTLLVAALGAATFLALQVLGWVRLTEAGIAPGSGVVASVYYALTVFHALHAATALALLAPSLARSFWGSSPGSGRIAALAWFFHLVSAAWLLIAAVVFV